MVSKKSSLDLIAVILILAPIIFLLLMVILGPLLLAPSPGGFTEFPPGVRTDKVEINDYSFSPMNISVDVGTTITWTNSDPNNITYSIISDRAGNSSFGFASFPIRPGQSYYVTFNETGQFNYSSGFQSHMMGTVIVNSS